MYQLGLYEKAMPDYLSLKEKMIIAKNSGFDFLELSIDETEEKISRLKMSQSDRSELVKIMYQEQMPIRSICLSAHRKYPLGHPDKKIQEISLKILEAAVDLADDLGVRYIQLAGYDVYYENSTPNTKSIFKENLIKAVQIASEKGVVLAFETMETKFMDTVKKSMKYVKDINSPYLKIYPDIGNLKNASLKYGTSVNEDLECGNGQIISAHLKETLPGVYREIEFGKGHTEYSENIELLKSQGVNRYVAEFWHNTVKNWENEIGRSHDFLREVLDQIYEK